MTRRPICCFAHPLAHFVADPPTHRVPFRALLVSTSASFATVCNKRTGIRLSLFGQPSEVSSRESGQQLTRSISFKLRLPHMNARGIGVCDVLPPFLPSLQYTNTYPLIDCPLWIVSATHAMNGSRSVNGCFCCNALQLTQLSPTFQSGHWPPSKFGNANRHH